MIASLAEVAELLGCTEETVVERINAGDIPALRFGRSWVVPRGALEVRINELALEQARSREERRGQPLDSRPGRKPIPALPDVKAFRLSLPRGTTRSGPA